MNVVKHMCFIPRMGVRRPPEAGSRRRHTAPGSLNLNLVQTGRKIREVSQMWTRTLSVGLVIRSA